MIPPSALIRALIAIAAFSATASPAMGQVPEAPRPNIIFVLTDDLGPGDIGVLWQNSLPATKRHRTPHLDRFAAEGRILSRHYTACPVCAPARASLLTGQHQGHSRVRDNQFDKELPNTHTLGTVLQEAGYATAAIGKWGLQGGTGTPGHPLYRGFDYFFGYLAHQDAHFHYPFEGNRPFYDGFTDIQATMAKSYSTDVITARAKKWIVDHTTENPGQPFFIYLNHSTPHAGLRVPTDSHLTATDNYPAGGGLTGGVQWIGQSGQLVNTATGTFDAGIHPEYSSVRHNGSAWPIAAQRHATMVRRIDDSMNDIMQLLVDLEIDDDTLIVFTSDNGTHNERGLDKVELYDPTYLQTFGPFDGIKRDLWEGGIRMPTLVRWPGSIPAGTTDNAASQFHDWMATFCELAGVPAPAFSDGRSLVPQLTGTGTLRPGVVYVEYNTGGSTPNYSQFEASHRGKTRNHMQAVFLGDYKGVRFNLASTPTFIVYNVVTDPGETTNLAGSPGVPTQAEFEAAALRNRRVESSATRPYDNLQIPALLPSAVVAGLDRRDYQGNFPWVPDFGAIEPDAESVVEGLDLGDLPTAGAFGMQFSGLLHVPTAGDHTFFLRCSGRAIVRLHGALLIDADANYTTNSEVSSGSIPLAAGWHPITINLTHASGSPDLQLSWQGPGIAKQPVPTSSLVRTNDSPAPDPGFFWLPLDQTTGSLAQLASGTFAGGLSGIAPGNGHWITGQHGGALNFDGVDDLLTINPAIYQPPTGSAPRTFSAWLRPASTQPELASWLSYGSTPSGQRMSLRVDDVGGARVLRCEIQGVAAVGSTRLDDGAWHHVAVVLDDLDNNGTLQMSEARFYVDGAPEPATLTGASQPVNTGTDFGLTIGGSAHLSTYEYAGGIDDVRIHDRALGAAEVAALAARPAEADLWHFQQTGNPEPDGDDWATVPAGTGHGLSALMLYALGGSLAADDITPRPELVVDPLSGDLSFRFQKRRTGLPDTSYQVRRSTNLQPEDWQNHPGVWQVDPDPERPDIEWVEVPVDGPGEDQPALFLRLRVALP